MVKKKKIESIVNEEINAFIRNARPQIKKILESSLLSLMGLEKNYQSNYEIDHCNGRNSVLIDAFRSLAVEEAKKMAKSYQPTKEDVLGFKTAFEREYKNQVSYVIRDAATNRAKKDVDSYISEIKIDIEKMIEEKI